MDLNKVKLAHSPLTDTIFLYRHGKDAGLALDKREAVADVMSVLVEYMTHDAPKGSEVEVTLGDKKYTIRVTPTNMTKEEVIAKLVECQRNGDTEVAHSHADAFLCDFLTSLGYADVVAEYKKVDKWYA